MLETLRRDIRAVFQRDPASRTVLEVLLCYPGLHAIWIYRVAHWFWTHRMYLIGRLISHWGRWLTGIEIHPGATIGPGLFIDHGMGVVIGETAEIGEDVTLYHGVTLGGVSWRKEKRHPTLGNHVVVGAGAKILGPVTIGDYTRIGANSVVVKDIPDNSVVVGVPGRVHSRNGQRVVDKEHEDLRHNVLHDITMEKLEEVTRRLEKLEQSLKQQERQVSEEIEFLERGYQGPWGI
ncbi:MAG: serine O-acetyltransferase [Caldilineae bacterium]|nr:MAG: serine O-acetyltransferase [Caldilineae bacterium]